MEKPEGIITEDDTVYDVITRHPELKEVLVRISPKYKRMYNPVIFNTVAKVTPLKKAAAVGNIYLKELLYQLNEAIGKGGEFLAYFKSRIPKMQEDFLKKQFAPSGGKSGEKPSWMGKAVDFSEFDARAIDEEPFSHIMKKAGSVKKGSGFVLVQKFEPAPIIAYLGTQGFEHWVEKISEDEVRVYFFKKL
ncbi:MAG TPA: DUF1858 domain-containing protein [Candidatus Goldiibacteriota bacterium]|nr:DUF1858 domain-containing protein [Candidatus Goldiibacteriota bacterium]